MQNIVVDYDKGFSDLWGTLIWVQRHLAKVETDDSASKVELFDVMHRLAVLEDQLVEGHGSKTFT